MSPKDHLIARLRALCAEHGVDTVADATASSEENLKQILAGTRLPSGAPRGVGPTLQRRLDAAYPGWSALTSDPPLAAALPTVTRAIARLSPLQWEMIRTALDRLPGHAEAADETAAALLPILSAKDAQNTKQLPRAA